MSLGFGNQPLSVIADVNKHTVVHVIWNTNTFSGGAKIEMWKIHYNGFDINAEFRKQYKYESVSLMQMQAEVMCIH